MDARCARKSRYSAVKLETGSTAIARAVCGHAAADAIDDAYDRSQEIMAERYVLTRAGIALDDGHERYRRIA